jgi:hypothetical protein
MLARRMMPNLPVVITRDELEMKNDNKIRY